MKKAVLLILALLLPVLIFLFLHFFGKNKFEIPVYYQIAEDMPQDCQVQYKFPYKVEASQIKFQSPAIIFFADGLSQDELKDAWFQLGRVRNELRHDLATVAAIGSGDQHDVKGVELQVLGDSVLSYERRCLWLTGSNRLVMLDEQNQIRGYYQEASLKEIDRLIVELKILFDEY